MTRDANGQAQLADAGSVIADATVLRSRRAERVRLHLAAQGLRSEISRALATCLNSEAGRRILAEDLAGTDVAPERGHGLVTRLLHDDELAHAVHRGLGHATGAERVPAELLDLQSRPTGCTLQELADGIGVQAAPRNMSVSSNGTEDRAIGNPGPVEPLAQRADRTRFLTGSKG